MLNTLCFVRLQRRRSWSQTSVVGVVLKGTTVQTALTQSSLSWVNGGGAGGLWTALSRFLGQQDCILS